MPSKERPGWEKRDHWWQNGGGRRTSHAADIPRPIVTGNELLMRQAPHRRFYEAEKDTGWPRMTDAESMTWRKRVVELLRSAPSRNDD